MTPSPRAQGEVIVEAVAAGMRGVHQAIESLVGLMISQGRAEASPNVGMNPVSRGRA